MQNFGVISLKTRGLVFPVAIGAVFLLTTGTASADTLKLRCTNTASGTSWDIAVDPDHGRVDNIAAQINSGSISWRDPENRTYELNRATGALRMRNASSTGGYYLYYTCRPE
jgi:hypothetical protein